MCDSLQEKSWLEQARWGIMVWLMVGVLLTAMQYLPRSVGGANTLGASNPLGALPVEYDPTKPPLASVTDLRATGTHTAALYRLPMNLVEPEEASTALTVGWINPEWLHRLLAQANRAQSQRLGGKQL